MSAPEPPVSKTFSSGGTTWSEPLALADMCALVAQAKSAGTKYRIVAGNTGHGVCESSNGRPQPSRPAVV